jgi:purine nucleosidase
MVIDTDGGVDDAAAIAWAATSPHVELLAVTAVHGNVDPHRGAANVCRVLEAVGRADIPVAVGADGPVGRVPTLRPADFIHGVDGLGNTHRETPSTTSVQTAAIDMLTDVVASRPGEVVVVTLGPLTNLATVIHDRPQAVDDVRRLVVMGGAIVEQGNALAAAEANIAHDPSAAARVVTAPWRRPPLLVGLDVTHRATLTATEMALLEEHRTPAAAFLDQPLRFYVQGAAAFCPPGESPCHDLLAVVAAAAGIVHGPVLPLAVQTEPGPAWGATVADRRVPFFERAGSGSEQATVDGFAPWEIGLHVDVPAFRREVRWLFGGGDDECPC